jgi:GNAT superfamily N-acetyltransferase
MFIRTATGADAAEISALIERSVRELQREDYSQRQIDLALEHVYGVDSALIRDGTYFVVLHEGRLVACGGWSKRKTLYGGDVWSKREDELLDPLVDAAKIRAFFVHPDFARRGIGTLLLETCENAAREAGFRHFEMGATLAGVRLYEKRGYQAVGHADVQLPDGESLAVIRMIKSARE